jgi:hypothetical protein
LNWLYAEGFLADKPRVQLLKFDHQVIATFSPEQVEKLLRAVRIGTPVVVEGNR